MFVQATPSLKIIYTPFPLFKVEEKQQERASVPRIKKMLSEKGNKYKS